MFETKWAEFTVVATTPSQHSYSPGYLNHMSGCGSTDKKLHQSFHYVWKIVSRENRMEGGTGKKEGREKGRKERREERRKERGVEGKKEGKKEGRKGKGKKEGRKLSLKILQSYLRCCLKNCKVLV